MALLSLLLPMVAAVSACSTKHATTEDASTETTVEASATATPPSTSDTATSDTGTDATNGAVVDRAGSAGSRVGSCPTQDDVDSMQNEIEAAAAAASSPDEVASEYDAVYGFLGLYLPEERQADLDVVRNAYRSYDQAVSGMDLSDPDALTDDQYAALEGAGQVFDAPEFGAAMAQIGDYFSQACPDVNLYDSGSATGDTTPN